MTLRFAQKTQQYYTATFSFQFLGWKFAVNAHHVENENVIRNSSVSWICSFQNASSPFYGHFGSLKVGQLWGQNIDRLICINAISNNDEEELSY